MWIVFNHYSKISSSNHFNFSEKIINDTIYCLENNEIRYSGAQL